MGIRTITKVSTGGGGGSANVAWGPDFGESSDGNTFTVGVNLDLEAVELENDKIVGVAVTMPELSLNYNEKLIGVNIDLDDIALENNKTVGVNLDLEAIGLENDKIVGVNVTMPELALENNKTVGTHLSGEVLGAPFWQSVSKASSTSGGQTSIACALPAGTVGGDLLLAFIGVSDVLANPAPIINIPSGWTEVINKLLVGAAFRYNVRAFFKIAGEIVVDSSSNGNNGTPIGTVRPSVVASPFSGFSNAFDFEGVDRDAATAGIRMSSTPAVLLNGSVGLEAKFRYDGNPPNDTGYITSSWGLDDAPSNINNKNIILGFFGVGSPDVGKAIMLWIDSSNVAQILIGTTVFTAGNTGTLEGNFSGTTARLFVNGFLEASNSATTLRAFNTALPLWIGRLGFENDGGGSPSPFNGAIDEVRWSNIARNIINYTPATVPFTNDANTLGLWHLDEIVNTGSEPANYTFDWTGTAAYSTAEIHRINGINATTPIDAATSDGRVLGVGNPTNPPAPAITTIDTNCLIFAYLYHDHLALSQSHTPPASHDERVDEQASIAATFQAHDSNTKVFSASGAQVAVTIVCSEAVNTDWITLRVAVKPGILIIAN